MSIRRALVSVSDKRGLIPFCRALARHGTEILSTGGTAKALADAGIPVVQVSAYTGAPEILDGRVKTLHPKLHGGLLGRPIPAHEAEMQAHGIEPIDLVVVNLYPFRETIAREGVTLEEAIENIDIGGPSMVRSAAKNYERVAVVVDPDDYAELEREVDRGDGSLSRATRFRLARKAFAHTAAYDGAIAGYLASYPEEGGAREAFPEVLTLQWRRERLLRYGENPHQQAAFYLDPAAGRRLGEVLQGKELSFNNLLDLDAALECAREFEEPAAVIVKHTNPCGVGTDPTGVAAAYRRARETDPVSAFGGIVALNRPVDAALGRELADTFLECVIAPAFDEAAREILGKKKNLRLLAVGDLAAREAPPQALRSALGGVLVQSRDRSLVPAREAKRVSKRAPTAEELEALEFAWRVAKHVKSNAIVFAHRGQTVGIGAGQMSRVDSVELARTKAKLPLAGTVVASDAFFPFRDGIDAAAQAGATAVIQPGGSVRDEEVIAAADEHGLAMVFTGMRHFRH